MQKERIKSLRVLALWLWKRWRQFRLQSVMNVVFGLLMVGAELAFVWFTKLAVDIATGANHDTPLMVAIAALIGVMMGEILVSMASRWLRAALGVRARNNLKRKLFDQLLHSEWKSLKSFHTGNLTNRIERDVNDVVVFLTENIPSFVTTCVRLVGAFLLLFYMDRMLACIVVCILPFFLLCSKLYIKKMRRITHEVRDTESRIQSIVQESLQHSLIIKTLERASHIVQRLNLAQQNLYMQVMSKTRYSMVSSSILNLGFATGYLTTFIWGVTSLQQGIITYGALIAFIQLVGQIQGPVRTLSQFVPIFISAFTAAERVMEVEKLPAEAAEVKDDEQSLVQLHKTNVGINIRQLTFFYSENERKIFSRFDFDFPPGSVTAILGETGAGKTSLIRLLLGLTSPCEGSIHLYDDKRVSTQICAATRGYFSYVPQGNTLLSGTIRENLLLGDPYADEQMMYDALMASSADFVLKLPAGLDTPCGEMGDGLSEGQAQRISIARALLKKSPILLLDEATSALDADTERKVLQNIIEQQQGRTLIFVTHRPEVLKYCTQHLNLQKSAKC